MNLIIQSVRQIKGQYPTINTLGLGALNKNKEFSKFIDKDQLKEFAEKVKNSGYGQYLLGLLES